MEAASSRFFGGRHSWLRSWPALMAPRGVPAAPAATLVHGGTHWGCHAWAPGSAPPAAASPVPGTEGAVSPSPRAAQAPALGTGTATTPVPGPERRGRKTPEPGRRPQPRPQNPGRAAAHTAPLLPFPSRGPARCPPGARGSPAMARTGPAGPPGARTGSSPPVAHGDDAKMERRNRCPVGRVVTPPRPEGVTGHPQRRCCGNQLRPLGA